jgi:signal transduction histidine kinase
MVRTRVPARSVESLSRSGDPDGRLQLRRIVRARDEERRRIERDLHDGAQQEVLAVMVGLDLVAQRAGTDPEVQNRLVALREQLDEALRRIRNLARGIFPPLLDQEGIPAALEAMAAGWHPPPTVICRNVARYPVEVETAIFFGCTEGLQNAVKHAGAKATISIEVAARNGAIGFEVRDDGLGLQLPGLRPAQGLLNIAERLEAVGGTLEVASTPRRGTVLSGTVPLAPAPGDRPS